jgi:hypothetical protein
MNSRTPCSSRFLRFAQEGAQAGFVLIAYKELAFSFAGAPQLDLLADLFVRLDIKPAEALVLHSG